MEVHRIRGPAAERCCRQGRSCSVSLPWFSLVASDVLFGVQRLTTQGTTIWEALFCGVCWDVICEPGMQSGVHLRNYGELPGRRLPRPIQRILQKRRQRYALPFFNLSRSLNFLQCMCIYPTWQRKQALVYSFRPVPLHTILPSLHRLWGWIGRTIRPRASRPTPHLSSHILSRRRQHPFLGDGRK